MGKKIITKIVRVNPDDPAAEVVREARRALKRGQIIVYPTDTFYALGGDALREGVIKRIYQLKGRDYKKPLPVIISDEGMLYTLVTNVPFAASHLIREFWPGPLTIILEASSRIPESLVAGTGKIALRIPGCMFAREISREFGGPIISTSANPSGSDDPVHEDQIIENFSGKVSYIFTAGDLKARRPSTVVDLTSRTIAVLREGEISADEINTYLSGMERED